MRVTTRKFAITLALLGLLLPSPATAGASGPAPSYPRPRYFIVAEVNFGGAAIQARETISYTNVTPSTLTDIVLTVIPAHSGSFTLKGARVNGLEAPTSLQGIVLEVKLPQALERGDSVALDLEFTLQLPQGPGRFGISQGVMTLGNWYPILAVYRTPRLASGGQPSGWDRHSFSQMGDPFFTEVADYAVELTTSEPLVVAYPGRLVSHEGNQWSFEASRVRDFALALSPWYVTESAMVDGVEIATYLMPGHSAATTQYLQSAQEMLRWLSREIAPYPYDRLAIAEVPGITYSMEGQEYPQLVFIARSLASSPQGIESYLSWIVIHEVAHQWFYGLVGNDQLYEPWLDEALTTWVSAQFYRANYPNSFPWVWEVRIANLLPEATSAFGVFPLNSSIYDFPADTPYFATVYRRGATFLEQARALIGEESFMNALRGYVSSFRYRIATGSAFLDLLQANTTQNLNPLIAGYFTYPQYLRPEPLALTLSLEESARGFIARGDATTDIVSAAAFLDDLPIGTATSSSKFDVELVGVPPGEHLLTVVATDAQGRRAERSIAFVSSPGLSITPTPVALLSPSTPPSPLPASNLDGTPGAHRIMGLVLLAGLVGVGIVFILARR